MADGINVELSIAIPALEISVIVEYIEMDLLKKLSVGVTLGFIRTHGASSPKSVDQPLTLSFAPGITAFVLFGGQRKLLRDIPIDFAVWLNMASYGRCLMPSRA